MAIDTLVPRSRRAVLAASLGGVAAAVAGALGRPAPVQALDPNDVVLGAINNSLISTIIQNTGPGDAFEGSASSSGMGVTGSSATGTGVYGESGGLTSPSAIGVHGVGGAITGAPVAILAGVLGESSSGIGVSGESHSSIGVQGTSDTFVGVAGACNAASGIGVQGGRTAGTAVYGQSSSGYGVSGYTSSGSKPAGIFQANGNNTGLLGYSGTGSAPASPAKTGVYGHATQDANSRGVHGKSTAGQGVRGEATNGVGVKAVATTGKALDVSGRAAFSRSGRTSIPANKSSVDVTVAGGLNSSASVLATLQLRRSGVYVAAVRPNYPSAGEARIYLNKVASTTAATPVGWFVLG